jgi:16S rRNA (cytidine(1402)-2'-O)-methyltransferase
MIYQIDNPKTSGISLSTAGKLYVVGTPIGNLEDMTSRAIRTLNEVDLIACEDTRRTQKLLNHYSIRTRTISYHEHNELMRAPELIIQMEEGSNIALVSDAGMPVISDPGYRLVKLAIRHELQVIPRAFGLRRGAGRGRIAHGRVLLPGVSSCKESGPAESSSGTEKLG